MSAHEPDHGGVTAAAAIPASARLLKEAGIEGASRDARILVAAVLGLDAAGLLARPEARLSPAQKVALDDAINRRCAREPISRIMGVRGFYGRDFAISPATLDPRPDSETLCEAALELVGAGARQGARLRILDVGTGSGCLLVTLLAELSTATGLGTDICPEALKVAEANARRHGVAGRAGWQLTRSLQGIEGPYDLLVTNPPYVRTDELARLEPEVREYDPRAALDGGVDGMDVYREIAADLGKVVPRGWALIEVGAGQAEAVGALLKGRGRDGELRIFRDLGGVERCVAWKARD